MTKYEVTGSTAFAGHQPGEVFDADLDEDLEARAIERGSIKKTGKNATVKEGGDA